MGKLNQPPTAEKHSKIKPKTNSKSRALKNKKFP